MVVVVLVCLAESAHPTPYALTLTMIALQR